MVSRWKMEGEDIIKSIKVKRRNQQASYNILNEDYMPKNREQHNCIIDNDENQDGCQQDNKYHQSTFNKLQDDCFNNSPYIESVHYMSCYIHISSHYINASLYL